MSEVIGGVLCYSIAVQYGDSFGIVLLPNGVMSLVTLTPFCPDPFFLSLKCNPTDALGVHTDIELRSNASPAGRPQPIGAIRDASACVRVLCRPA